MKTNSYELNLANFNEDLQELTFQEALETDGGESGWYWICYGIGQVGRAVEEWVTAEPIRPSLYR